MSSPETTWGVGEYPLMARHLRPAAVAAVDAAAVLASERVVDVATGTGNVALVAAERGGQVIGVDFEPALLRVAEQRASDAGCDVRWLRGDLAALPVPDDWADVVLSVFGVMYAGDQAAAVGELARVAAPGARVVLASWVPGSVLPAMGQVLNGYLPPATYRRRSARPLGRPWCAQGAARGQRAPADGDFRPTTRRGLPRRSGSGGLPHPHRRPCRERAAAPDRRRPVGRPAPRPRQVRATPR